MTTTPGQTVVLPIVESSQPGEARRAALVLAGHLGFGESSRGQVALVVTEIATNLVKHAQGGELILRALGSAPGAGLEVLALDRGPGMADVARCLVDGYSTAGSPGTGLGAITRLSGLFDIDSQPGVGTAVVARFWPGPDPAPPAVGLEVGAVCLPMAGEEACGDAWAIEERGGSFLVLVADGLGHGPQAAEASRAAVRAFGEQAAQAPADIIRAAHAALRSTRGAAVAVLAVDRGRREARFAGVGNISGAILPPGAARTISMVSHNGTVGHEMRKVQEFTYPWPDGALLVLHSDGLGTQWRLDRYPGLQTRHPSLVAGVLYRDFKRGRDDVTVLVAREQF